ncbi:hypothetical protein SAMN02745248_02348 [Hathewaya proteolytica DSM 3090]|uniref:Phosphoenolpyruvate carboxykinase n=1 Tax=Hathewaya proteolytica DSM 3090 TaxID=1121331 RepID=A0A1M6RPM4_9CLOT|nr:hypothetical protein [Hathewaya proteolytica]SHK34416.1 hypothetical protein SAMN02745248_02348 [Hathewaya proteolytica DSM 3090]
MSYKFKIKHNNAILNFSEEYCQSRCELIESESFSKVLKRYLDHISRKNSVIYSYLSSVNEDKIEILKDLKTVFKLLLIVNTEEIIAHRPNLEGYLQNKDEFLKLVEDLYLYWRRLQRYAIVFNNEKRTGYQNVQFADAQSRFEELVLSTYRSIEEQVMGKKNKVYRQIKAGVNAGLTLTHMRSYLPYEYRNLDHIPFIESVIIHPPFIAYSKRNKRDGIFMETKTNPLEDKKFDSDQWICYPAKVGNLLAFVYFNQRFMAQGVALCNLFELAIEEEYRNRKPDLIYVYGYEDHKENEIFYEDSDNDIIVGFLSSDDKFDYFGYMKKMILTLHNVKKLNQNQLPIHGAMVKMTMLDGKTNNIIIMGDSGAGKSETIEQLKIHGESSITDIKTIYDDMGVLLLDDNGTIKSSGTEIGAFVRLDDLDTGYSFKELDRSVFMNPDKINARIIIPITDYKDVVENHPVDYIFYANNYEEGGESISFFGNASEALEVFRAGRRFAKGTTTEKGIVESYFANPFGPVQRREQTDLLLTNYFGCLFKQNIKVGEIRTRLGIEGQEHQGPKEAAMAILELLREMK